MDEQKTVTMQFPMPSWLHDLRRQLSCLKGTSAGQVADASDGRSSSVNELLEPVTMTEDDMAADLLPETTPEA